MQDLEFIIQRKILKVGSRLNNTRDATLRQYDLTSGQSEALLFFDAHPGARALDLKEHLQISHQAARSIVERIRLKGMVSLTPSAEDARAKEVRLTARGQEICSSLKAAGSTAGGRVLENLTEAEKRTLYALLDKIHTD